MDRNKSISNTRGPKSKITQQSPDMFIALGSKQSTSRDVDSKRSVALSKPSTSHLSTSSSKGQADRKREGAPVNLQAMPPSKKMKVSIPNRPQGISGPSISNLHSSDRTQSQTGAEPWEALVIECDPCDLVEYVLSNVQLGNMDKCASYLLGAIKNIRGQRFKPCRVLYSSLLLICQCKPSLYSTEHVVTALVSSLRRDVNAGVKNTNKVNVANQMLFVNLLLQAFNDVVNWPDVFVKLYVEDAMGDRVWIDNPYCKSFVDNVTTAFGTKHPPKLLLAVETWTLTGRDTSSPLTINTNDDDENLLEHRLIVENWNVKQYPRYTQSQDAIEAIVLEAIKEQLARRQQPDSISKNFVRFLSTACGLIEIRVIAISRIENWLHNHKLMKSGQELLAYLCYNCSANTQRDLEVVSQLSKLRLKNKPMVNFFNSCLKEMVIAFPENLYPLLKYTIYNELSNTRNTNNLFVVAAMFQVAPEPSADAFADISLELLLNKDDYLRSLRTLMKEINRVLRHDFNLLNIAHALLRERRDLTTAIKDSEFRERIFLSLADLVCMCMMLSVTSQVRDAATQSKRDVTVLQAFQAQVSSIQREAIMWLHDTAMRVFKPNINDFQHILHKVLLLEQVENYCKIDSWPGENERLLYLRLTSEVPLLESTLVRVLLMGISKEHPINPNEIIDISDQLIKRVANLPFDCIPPLVVEKIEVVDIFLNMCSYNYPENIGLPIGYIPPKLAISSLYWKSWLILLVLAAHNPKIIGKLAWEHYPILKMFMEMCITNHFSFPPPTMLTEQNADDFSAREQQVLVLEKQKILEFETHLAAASTKIEINEQSSLLLPQLMELDPQGTIRRPPPMVLEQLQSLNNTHRLGHLLCRSRNPDFLLEIMTRQGNTAQMPWLAELVHSSEGALAHLPVQCLCEYLLSNIPTEKLTKHSQLLAHLRAVVSGQDQNALDVLDYLLRRLSSLNASSRIQATKGLTLVLNPNEEVETSSNSVNNTHWLTRYIAHYPNLSIIRPLLIQCLRQAVLVETNPVHVSNYIKFLSCQGVDDTLPELLELILDLASLVVERSSITNYILPGENMQALKDLISIFYTYLQKVREPLAESIPWSENQDQVNVSWSNGEHCILQILIVHASIILLTYGPVDDSEHFAALLDMWFPLDEEHPKAYLADTSEEALLVPDWLKLRMIRSNVSRLVDAAVEKLEAPQLVLFIQSFGIPVVSISKLLQTLDRSTVEDPKLVVDSVLDKNYMIQLVEVQNRRGAVGGEIFVHALEMHSPFVEEDPVIKIEDMRKPLPALQKKVPLNHHQSINMLQCLNDVFNPDGPRDNAANMKLLIKALQTDSDARVQVLDHFERLRPPFIVKCIEQNKSLVTIFRLVLTKNNINIRTRNLANNLLKVTPSELSLFESILIQFLQENETSLVKTEEDVPPMDDLKPDACSPKDFGKQVCAYTTNLEKLLLMNFESEKAGYLVDYLIVEELAGATSVEKEQINLLFSKKQLVFRPLIMSLLLQRANWNTLSEIVKHLLQCENLEQYCCSSVLDFLTALTESPKLWQGRDKAIPKHSHPEDVLNLNSHQLKKLIEYILQESLDRVEMWKEKMMSRLPLLKRSLNTSSLSKVIGELTIKSKECEKAQHLALILYMSLPNLKQHFGPWSKDVSNEVISNTVDVVSNTLISAMTSTVKCKDWNRRSMEYELCLRKLTATHPHLVLRQLLLLAGSLGGRSLYEWSILKSRGHYAVFNQVLGILELLQPHLFQRPDALCKALDAYFSLMSFHGPNKELSTIISRVVTLLQNWMVKDIKSALKYLQRQGHILNDIQISQPCVRPLLSSVSFPSLNQSDKMEQVLVGTATPPVPEPLPQNWPSIITGLQSHDPLPSLQDLDHITGKKPQLLLKISQHLYNGIGSQNNATRVLSLNLMLKLLKYDPNVSSEALPSILSNLENRNSDIVENILNRLPEIVITMQEYALLILKRVFQLGVNSNLNTSSSISKSIALLNLQSGC